MLGASALYDDPVAGCKTRRRRTSRKLRHDLGLTAVLTACENRPVRAAGPLLTLVLIVGFVAGCGGGDGTIYSADKSRACLVEQGRVVRDPPASDVVASAAEGGAFSVRFGDNLVTVSFGSDRDGAERTVRAYQRFRGKNIGLLDVLHAERNAVLLWAIHPQDAEVRVIEDCLR